MQWSLGRVGVDRGDWSELSNFETGEVHRVAWSQLRVEFIMSVWGFEASPFSQTFLGQSLVL